MNNIDTLKSELKALASTIVKAKPQRKTVHFTGERTMTASQADTVCRRSKYQFRHLHIAYCELRGKTIEQIEPKNKKTKPSPNRMYIDQLKEKYAWPVEEVQVAV